MTLCADVVVPLPLERSFRYLVPESAGKALQPGVRVLIPFGRRELTGFVVGVSGAPPPGGPALKEISAVLDEEPIFSSALLSFTRELARRSYSSWGEILQSAVPPSLLIRTLTTVALTQAGEQAVRKGGLGKREKELTRFLGGRTYSRAFLARKLRLPDIAGLVARMEKKGLLLVRKSVGRGIERRKRAGQEGLSPAGTQLQFDFPSRAPSEPALRPLFDRLYAGGFASFLVRGSSRRREDVYAGLLDEIAARSGKALVILPEVSLARALGEKLENRLGKTVAVLHGELSESRREREWRRIREGRASVVCGTRSALLAPVERPRLILVDEEQEDSYLQGHPSFDLRQGARLRAELEECLFVSGAGYPTIEGYHRAREGGWLIDLGEETSRVRVEVSDAKLEKNLIGGRLKRALDGVLSKGEQAIVFFNRRGYATSLICSRCSHIPKCRRCDISLVLHKRTRRLVCPLCGETETEPAACPRCGRSFRARGAGIEAVEEELRRLFPGAPLAVFNIDALSSRAGQEAVLKKFVRGGIKILLGTELLARRRDLGAVPLVGILAPEITLALPDLRAGQRTFQALLRMIRFCRAGEGSRVVIQTALPDHYVVRSAAAQDYGLFFGEEIQFRRLLGYPPFSEMAEVVLEGRDLRTLGREARRTAEEMRTAAPSVEVMGPAMAAVPRVKGMFRVQVVLRAESREAIDALLARSLAPRGGRRSVVILS